MFLVTVIIIYQFAACCVCKPSHITEIVDIYSDRRVLECRRNINHSVETVAWNIMYEDGTHNRYTCMNMPRGKTILDCSVSFVGSEKYKNAVECGCSYDGVFSIYVILREPMTSLHRCLIDNMTTVLREFFVTPEVFIHVGYLNMNVRRISCCVNNTAAAVTANMTRNGAVVQYSKSCTDKQCFTSLSDISEDVSIMKYGCDVVLTMWNITVSRTYSALIADSKIASVSETIMNYMHSGACSGRVTWIYNECNNAGRECDYQNNWLSYNGEGTKVMHGWKDVQLRLTVKKCVNDMSSLHAVVTTPRMHFKVVSCVFSEHNDIFVYETRFVDKLDIHIYDGRPTYIKCTTYNFLSHLSITALSGCDNDKMHEHGFAKIESASHNQFACISVEHGCIFGAAWVMRDRIVTGPTIIENVTSYASRNGHCVAKQVSRGFIHNVESYMYISTSAYFALSWSY